MQSQPKHPTHTHPVLVLDYYEEESSFYTKFLCEPVAAAGGEVSLLKVKSAIEILPAYANAIAIATNFVPIEREVLQNLPQCGLLIRGGIGYEVIDVAAATEFGILVCNTPFCIPEVADHTFALLLALARGLPRLMANAHAGRWDEGLLDTFAQNLHRLEGQTLGLVGYGNIARAVARRAVAFGLKVLAYDPYLDWSRVDKTSVTPTTLEVLLQAADYVSLHVPLTSQTQGMFTSVQFRQMKPTAFLLNMSRGAVLNETDLIRALQQGWIAGAGLDVLAQEPPSPQNPLLHMDNVVITPHFGAASLESTQVQHRQVGEAVVAFLQGEIPPHVVNPAAIPKRRSIAHP